MTVRLGMLLLDCTTNAPGKDDDMADSFCLVPSKADPSAALKQENALLKAQLDEERKKLAMAERVLKQRQEQDLQLRDSIMLARKEVSISLIAANLDQSRGLQAHRAMASSMAIRPPQPLVVPAPPALVAPSTPPAVPVPPVVPVDIGALNINVPPAPSAPPTGGRDREAQLVRRVRELEEDVRLMRVENDKQVRHLR